MNARKETLLWVADRASTAVLAVCVLVHLVTIIYAVRSGLSAAEILGRTRGNLAWLVFYAVFVVAVAVHAPLGLRSVLFQFIVQSQQEILPLPHIGNAAIFHSPQCICNCLPLGIQHRSFQRDIDMSLHPV